MSLYHNHTAPVGKSQGKSAVGMSAYISGQSLTQFSVDKESGLVTEQTFSRAEEKVKDVVFEKMYAPDGSPSWCYDREAFWNKVEQVETRVNAMYARHIDVALQVEFDLETNKQILDEYVKDSFVSNGIVADVAIHDDGKNPHAHILINTRYLELNEGGEVEFGLKNRLINSKSFLCFYRQRWADINNKYFKIHDIDKSISHESYEKRGFGFLKATIHEGDANYTKGSLERVEENKQIVQENFNYIKENPLEVVKALMKQKAVFSKVDLANELDKFFEQVAFRGMQQVSNIEIEMVQKEVLQSYDEMFNAIALDDQVVKICDNDLEGKALYSTKAQLELEKNFLSNVDQLNSSKNHVLNLDNIEKEVADRGLAGRLFNQLKLGGSYNNFELSEEQKEAILNIANGSDISLLIGRPGTGKSTVMEPLIEEYKKQGYRVFGAATQAKAARSLGDIGGIEAYTLDKWRYDWQRRDEIAKGNETLNKPTMLLPKLTSKDVFIIDEISMVDLKTMDYMLDEAKRAGCKVIAIGDDNQLSAINFGGVTEKLMQKLEYSELTEVFRQKNELDKSVNVDLSNYRVDKALKSLVEGGRFKIAENQSLTRQALINDYMEQIGKDEKKDLVVISYTNENVKSLNLEIRERLLDSGRLQSKYYEAGGREIQTQDGVRSIAIGERIVFNKNNRYLNIVNGDIGVVTAIGEQGTLGVELISQGKQGSREVIIDPSKYNHFDYGYAITSYKSQGMTYQDTLILLDEQVGFESFNVMATRHRENANYYMNNELLKEVIDRRFDQEWQKDNKENYNDNNLQFALFEMLARREYSAFANDYADFNVKKEVVNLRNYLAVKEDTSELYKEMLTWKEEQESGQQKVEVWQHERWGEFVKLKDERQATAKEILENFSDYKPYLSNAKINYSSLLSHAKMGELQFSYSDLKEGLAQSDDIANSYNELKELHTGLAGRYNHKAATKLIELANELEASLNASKETKLSLKDDLSRIQDTKWIHQSKINAGNYYLKDFENYIATTFKGDAAKVIHSWENLKKEKGAPKALANLQKDPSCIGSLKGIGFGSALAITVSRDRSVKNLESVKERFSLYEQSKIDISEHINKLDQLERSNEQKKILENIDKIAANSLTTKQEKHLLAIITNQENLRKWFKSKESISLAGTLEHNKDVSKELVQQEIVKEDKQAKYTANLTLSLEEVHSKLCQNIDSLAPKLMEQVVGKRVISQNNQYKCGSMVLSKEHAKQGLWYRFSAGKGGNLFDLIASAYNHHDIKDSIEWARDYLGEKVNFKHTDRSLNQNQKQQNKAEKNILMPVPQDAHRFNANRDLHFMLSKKNNRLEGVYEYRNIENQLCGYVVRIKDTENGTKQTLPVIYEQNEQSLKGKWSLKGFGDKRPLYNEHLLALQGNQNKPVLVVEGEKTADAAQEMYPEFVVVSWSGGANAYNKTSWAPLKDKEVVIWPDNDKPGGNAAIAIKDKLIDMGAEKVNIVDCSKLTRLPEKWDLADKLPESMEQYSISNILFKAAGMQGSEHHDRIKEEYTSSRQAKLTSELKNESFSSMGEYLMKKDAIESIVKIERDLLQELLSKGSPINDSFILSIRMNASELHRAQNRINYTKELEEIKVQIIEHLAKANPKHDMVKIKHIFNESVSHASSLTFKHIGSVKHGSNTVEKNILLPMAHSLASSIFAAEKQGLDISNHHTMSHIKNSFNQKIEREMQSFEHHQQMQMQRQKTKQAEMEM